MLLHVLPQQALAILQFYVHAHQSSHLKCLFTNRSRLATLRWRIFFGRRVCTFIEDGCPNNVRDLDKSFRHVVASQTCQTIASRVFQFSACAHLSGMDAQTMREI